VKKIDKFFICLIILGIINRVWSLIPIILIYAVILIVRKIKSDQVKVDSINTHVSHENKGLTLKCAKCGSVITEKHKFCENCGEAIAGDNIKVEMNPNATPVVPQKTVVKSTEFDSMFSLSEDAMIYEFLNRELTKAGLDKNSKLIPSAILKRRKILNIIFSVLTFILVSLIFFHFPIFTYIFGIIILFFSYKLTSNYNFMEYLKKEVKSRPSEKVSNIVMNLKQTMVEDTSGKILLYGLLASIILPLLIFIKPMIWYEKVDGGYGVRYYIFGVTNFTSATIPEKHKGEDIIMLRGNTFSNMPLLKEIKLPDTITEIRGQAFKNNKALKSVKLPSNLNYLGGGAFYGCSSLESIEIPDSVTYIGGEAFYKATKLKSVKLPENLTEIRGNTFEYCRSLESIIIPDNVTRIGGHAFYGNSSLSSVTISQNSQLTEIGSSAFRLCHNLYEIFIPEGVYVNERAFKESPTQIKKMSKAENLQVYTYKKYIQLQIGESINLKEVLSSNILYEHSLSLVNVIKNNGLYEFTFNLDGQEFTLTDQYRYHQINDNFLIQVDNYSGYVDVFGNNRDDLFSNLGATNYVSGYIYYN